MQEQMNEKVLEMADELSEEMAKRGTARQRIEGYQAGRWIVLDFGEILVHIFHQEEREFYDIARLWISGENSQKYTVEYLGNKNAPFPNGNGAFCF